MTIAPSTNFNVQWLLSLPEQQRTAVLAGLTEEEAELLEYTWEFWGRPEDQLEPTEREWVKWLYMAGRGTGKTRTGSEFIRKRVKQGARRIALVAQTPADARDVMIEGESGILAISPPWNKPVYEPSKRRLTWPSGAYATTFSGANPDQLRGPQFDTAWCDELGAWQYARDTWDNLMFGLRIGDDPKVIVTTTPKPISLLREIRADESTVLRRGSSYANRLNLNPVFFREIISRYEGTRTGQQEIYGELLDEAEGALWRRIDLERTRMHPDYAPAEFDRIVIAIDIAVTATEESDETGIVASGRIGSGFDAQGYVLEDGSGRYTPDGWANHAIGMFDRLRADRIVAEVNNGGDMIESTVRTVCKDQKRSMVPFTSVHASQGKMARAEPIAALYEQGKVHHVGLFPELEDQLCGWEPLSGTKSPDRLDALVWAFTELMLGKGSPGVRFLSG